MRKYLFLTVCIHISLFPALSRHFKLGIGSGFFVYGDDVYNEEVGLAITYAPAYYLAEGGTHSFSAGMPVTIGISNDTFGFKDQQRETTNFMLNVPLLLQYNFGAGAVKDPGLKFGFFVGLGPGFNMSPVTYFRFSFHTGMRFSVGNHGHNPEVRLSTLSGGSSLGLSLVTLGCIFNF